MLRRSRFDCPSAALSLKALVKQTQKVMLISLGMAAGMHLGLTVWTISKEQAGAAKPLTTQFIKRQPRLTKPLELKKRPRPKRRALQRTMVSVQAKATRHGQASAFRPTQLVRSLARPKVDIGRIATLSTIQMEPRSLAQAITGSKESEQKIDMSLEMMDLDALDIGRYHAMIVQDPTDKKKIRGYFHLAVPYSPSLRLLTNTEVGTARPIMVIVEAMNRYTDIKVDLGESFPIHSQEIFKTPFVFLTAGGRKSFDLSLTELEALGNYMMAGGFVLADNDDNGHQPVDMAFRRMFKLALGTVDKAFGRHWTFEKLPKDHALFHCFFDFNELPAGNDEYWRNWSWVDHPFSQDYLEGITIGDRLWAVFSNEDYTTIWDSWGQPGAGRWSSYDPTRHYHMGVNFVVFALTQEGSITYQLMESVY